LHWASASGIDPTSRGQYINAQHLAVVYAFYGIDQTAQPGYAQDPNGVTGPQWEALYRTIIDSLEIRFASQVAVSNVNNAGDLSTPQAGIFTDLLQVTYNPSTDRVSVDPERLVTALVSGAPSDSVAAHAYYDYAFRLVRGLRVDLFNGDSASLTTAVLAKLVSLGVYVDLQKVAVAAMGITSIEDESAVNGTIALTSANGVVFLGAGNKSIAGGAGNIYVYSADAGNDVVTDTSGSAKLVVSLTSSEVTLWRPDAGDDLVVVNNLTGASLTLRDYFNGARFEYIVFTDGVTLATDSVKQVLHNEAVGYLASSAAAADDFGQKQLKLAQFGLTSVMDEGIQTGLVSGTSGANVLLIGSGDKTIAGAGGADFYVYSADGGNVTIDDGANNGNRVSALVFNGISSTDVTLSRPNGANDLLITNNVTGKTITVRGEYAHDGPLPTITFSDGVSWGYEQIRQMLIDQQSATLGASIYGYVDRDDTLIAGLGDRYLAGEGGADTYVYSSAGGNDVIADSDNYHSTLRFTDIASTDVTISRPGGGDNLLITNTITGKTVTVQREFANGGPLLAITFSDGVSWTQSQVQQMLIDQESAAVGGSVYGFWTNETLNAGLGDKYLNGHGGADTYVYTSAGGNDTIADPSNQLSTLQFADIASTDVTISRPGGGTDLVITNTITGKTVTVQGEYANGGQLATITFSDGVTWSYTQVQQMLIDQESAAVGGAVYGFWTNETLNAGLGDKYLNGRGGADTYVYTSAGGNDIIADPNNQLSTLQFADIASTDVTISRPNRGDDLVITNTLTGKTVTVQGEYANGGQLATITFSDGVSWSYAQVQQMLIDQQSAAVGGSVYGFWGNDTINAGLGNKYLNGGGGADTYVYTSAGGNDVVADPGNFLSTLQFADIASTDVTLSRSSGGDDLFITGTVTGKTVTVQREFANGGPLLAITFADGVSWTQAQVEDILNAGGGASHNYLYSRSDGQVTLDGTVHTVQMGPGITRSDILFQTNGSGDLFVALRGTNDLITVHNDLLANGWGVSSTLGEIKFSDGTSLELGQPTAGQGSPITFTWFANSAYSSIGGSTYGSNEFVVANHDVTVNFANTSAIGGSNTLKYALGTGPTDINLNGGTGAIAFGTGVSAQDIYLQANGNGDLVVRNRQYGSDNIVVHSDLTVHSDGTVTSGLGELEFSDGTSVELGQPNSGQGSPLTFTWFGSSAYSAIGGSTYGSNIFEVANHDVTVNFANTSAIGGSNTLKYVLGTGYTDINLNGGTGAIVFGTGVSAQDIYLQANSNGDLIVRNRQHGSDSIVVHSDLTVRSDGTVRSGLDELEFSDGTSLTLGQPSAGQGSPVTFTWFGSSAYSAISGSTYGSNVFEITTYNVTVNFANASAVGGSNTLKYALGTGYVDINLNGGTGAIVFGTGVSAQDIYLQANGNGDLIVRNRQYGSDSIVVHSDLTVRSDGTVASGLGELKFSDGTSLQLGQPGAGQGSPVTFTWLGNSAYGTLNGSSFGSNVFEITTYNVTVNFTNASAVGGNNTIKYTKGSGPSDVYLNGATGAIEFGAGVSAQDVYLQANGNGDLIVRNRQQGSDSIVVHSDLTVRSDGTVASGLGELNFSDGTSLTLGQPSAGQGSPLTFTWLGNSAYSAISGSAYGSNVFEVANHDVTVNFANASAIGGSNTLKYGLGTGYVDINLNGGTGAIAFGAGVAAQDVYFQVNGSGDFLVKIRGDNADSILVHNDLTQNSWGVSSGLKEVRFNDGTAVNIGQPAAGEGLPVSFTWIGTGDGNSFNGSSYGANIFEFGPGSETATGGKTDHGGPGNNTYKVSASTGHATINANESAGTSNELDFIGGIADDQLWFLQSGNDLNIDLLGTNTQVSIKDWFSSSSNQLQEITAGGLKIDSQISQLVQAMATYSANNSGFDPTSSTVHTLPNDTSLQNSVAAAWHA
jgi:hypothetical protein